MKKKLLAPKQLRQRWWWNQKEIRKRGVTGVDWPLVEEAARNYELMRRYPEAAKEFPKTYLALNDNEKAFVHRLWCNWPQSASRIVSDKAQFDQIGWTTVYENQRAQWNLRAPDSVLKKAFMHEIKVSRAIQKIRPRHALKGKNSRGASWRYIEAIDLANSGGEPLNDSERKSASTGAKMAAQFFAEFQKSLKEWLLTAKRSQTNAPPGSQFTLCSDLSEGVKRILAGRKRTLKHLSKTMSSWDIFQRYPELLDEQMGFFTHSEFFNFKIIHSSP